MPCTRHVAEFVTTEIRGARREISAQRALTKLTFEINGSAPGSAGRTQASTIAVSQ